VTLHPLHPLHLLAGGALLHLGYAMAPLHAQPMVWNALGALGRLALVLVAVYPITAPGMAAVVSWLAAEELQVAVCNLAFAVRPWEIQAGQEMCSTLLGTDLSKFAAVAVIALLAHVYPTNLAR
jgi:hypothetical protein